MSKARYMMVGGFLGAGKTTSIHAFARHLQSEGLSVGLITNDQGSGLVDSAVGRASAFPVEEIGGGCFCCRFNSLIEAARNLTEATRPDVLLAEPVGSCTDLVATVSLPLQQIYGQHYEVSPFSVLVDPVRALRILGLEEGKRFSPNVCYIYRKQLEEADLLVINKVDLLSQDRRDRLRQGLEDHYPGKPVYEVSARDGEGLHRWFSEVLEAAPSADGKGLSEIDYTRYGQGESLLGWLNAALHFNVKEPDGIDGNALLRAFADGLRRAMGTSEAEIAHLKMTLTPRHDPYEIGAINLVRDGCDPELSHRLVDALEDGELLVNIRAEASPETLEKALQSAVTEVLKKGLGLDVKTPHLEHFRPGMPEPTHRINSAP